MLFRRTVLDGIEARRITLAFRRGARPPAKAGGTLLTAIGQVAFDQVERVDPAAITHGEAQQAGFADRDALIAVLARGTGPTYRVTLRLAGPDPRLALREAAALTTAEAGAVAARLARMDQAAPQGPWTWQVLEAIAAEPGRRAPDLAARFGRDVPGFKAAVRRLKALGLTESLPVGYRLSPRGEALLRWRR